VFVDGQVDGQGRDFGIEIIIALILTLARRRLRLQCRRRSNANLRPVQIGLERGIESENDRIRIVEEFLRLSMVVDDGRCQ